MYFCCISVLRFSAREVGSDRDRSAVVDVRIRVMSADAVAADDLSVGEVRVVRRTGDPVGVAVFVVVEQGTLSGALGCVVLFPELLFPLGVRLDVGALATTLFDVQTRSGIGTRTLALVGGVVDCHFSAFPTEPGGARHRCQGQQRS